MKPKETVGIQVGPSPTAIKEARQAIIEIIRTTNAEAVKIEALKALHTICGVNNTTISGCHIQQGQP